MTFGYPWTVEEITFVSKKWLEGHSAGEISKMTGRTRSAVLGRLHREGLSGNGSRVVRPQRPKPPPRPKPDRIVVPKAKRLPIISEPTEDGVFIWQVTGCKYPIGQRAGHHVFCDHASDGKPYCPEHDRLCNKQRAA